MEEINTIEDMAKEYFQSHNDNYIINKAVLGKKLEIGTTKTEVICKELEAEFPFIRNGRGFITIDKKGFEEFEVMREEQEKHISTFVELKAKFPQLAKSIDYYIGEIAKLKVSLPDKEKENAELKGQADELQQKFNDLDNSTKETKAKIENLQAEYDRLKAESDQASREYGEKTEAEIKRLEEESESKKKEAKTRLEKARQSYETSLKEVREMDLENKRLNEEESRLTPRSFYNWVKEDKSIFERLMLGFLWFCFYLFLFNGIGFVWDNGSLWLSSLINLFGSIGKSSNIIENLTNSSA